MEWGKLAAIASEGCALGQLSLLRGWGAPACKARGRAPEDFPPKIP